MAFTLTFDGRKHEIDIIRRHPHLVVAIDGRTQEISAGGDPGDGRQSLEIGGTPVEFTRVQMGDRQIVRLAGRNFEVAIHDHQSGEDGGDGGHNDVKAPMPGVVVAVSKSVGEAVARGETLITIESMKLQTTLPAPRDGVIAEILRGQGDVFDKDEVILRLEVVAKEVPENA